MCFPTNVQIFILVRTRTNWSFLQSLKASLHDLDWSEMDKRERMSWGVIQQGVLMVLRVRRVANRNPRLLSPSVRVEAAVFILPVESGMCCICAACCCANLELAWSSVSGQWLRGPQSLGSGCEAAHQTGQERERERERERPLLDSFS